MVRKLTIPGAPSACALAQEVDIHQSTLSRWVREYGKCLRVNNRSSYFFFFFRTV